MINYPVLNILKMKIKRIYRILERKYKLFVKYNQKMYVNILHQELEDSLVTCKWNIYKVLIYKDYLIKMQYLLI